MCRNLGEALRSGSGEKFSGFQQRFQPGKDHRPAAVELIIRALAELIVGHLEQTGIGDLLDLPSYPGSSFRLDILAPKGAEALNELAGRIDLQIFAFQNLGFPELQDAD